MAFLEDDQPLVDVITEWESVSVDTDLVPTICSARSLTAASTTRAHFMGTLVQARFIRRPGCVCVCVSACVWGYLDF